MSMWKHSFMQKQKLGIDIGLARQRINTRYFKAEPVL